MKLFFSLGFQKFKMQEVEEFELRNQWKLGKIDQKSSSNQDESKRWDSYFKVLNKKMEKCKKCKKLKKN